jgi:hypothetical protein
MHTILQPLAIYQISLQPEQHTHSTTPLKLSFDYSSPHHSRKYHNAHNHQYTNHHIGYILWKAAHRITMMAISYHSLVISLLL